VRSVAEENPQLRLVRFNQADCRWYGVTHIPRLFLRPANLIIQVIGLLLAPFFYFGRRQRLHNRTLPRVIFRLGRYLHHLVSSDWVLEEDKFWRDGTAVEFSKNDVVLLMDIPQDTKHLLSLRGVPETYGVKLVTYLHDLIPITQRPRYDETEWTHALGDFQLYMDVVLASDTVICNSLHTRDDYLSWSQSIRTAAKQRIDVVYPTWPQVMQKNDKSSSLTSFGMQSDARILAIGATDKRKNFWILLAALRHLVEEIGRSGSLILVSGSSGRIDPKFSRTLGSLRPAIRQQVRIVSSVSEEELDGLYSWATVVAVPSMAEGFGLPVVEALARRTNVVVSNTTSLIELAKIFDLPMVSPDSESGWARSLLEASKKPGNRRTVPKEFPQSHREFLSRILSAANPQQISARIPESGSLPQQLLESSELKSRESE